jgi:signal transduction histidine kinase
VFWRGQARTSSLQGLLARFLGNERAERSLLDHARSRGMQQLEQVPADARLVQFVETQLAGAIGSASARVMVASVVEEEPLDLEEVMRILEESSELRATSAELRAANEQLRSLDRLKDDFMSSVTHELRTPLTSIRAFAELMVDDPAMDAAQRQQFLALIVAETERLTRLVNQVLDLAKIESGNAEWHNSEVDLRALLEQAVQTTAELFREKGAQLTLEAPAGLPPLWLDRDRLLQVLMNLLSNAAKFMPASGGRVELRLLVTDQAALIEVEDNGAGVPEQERDLIFERFRQGDGGVRQAQGTGLGLPISRQIIEHFGGELSVHSGALGGACFRFSLPWRSSAAAVSASGSGAVT